MVSRSVRRMDAGGCVGVHRQQHDVVMAAIADVGGVHAGVGADETVARFGDQHAVLHADDTHSLPQDDLHGTRVLLPCLGEFQRARRGFDGTEVHDPALRLRDDLLRDDEHVVIRQRRTLRLSSGSDETTEVIPGGDLRQSFDAQEGHFGTHRPGQPFKPFWPGACPARVVPAEPAPLC